MMCAHRKARQRARTIQHPQRLIQVLVPPGLPFCGFAAHWEQGPIQLYLVTLLNNPYPDVSSTTQILISAKVVGHRWVEQVDQLDRVQKVRNIQLLGYHQESADQSHLSPSPASRCSAIEMLVHPATEPYIHPRINTINNLCESKNKEKPLRRTPERLVLKVYRVRTLLAFSKAPDRRNDHSQGRPSDRQTPNAQLSQQQPVLHRIRPRLENYGEKTDIRARHVVTQKCYPLLSVGLVSMHTEKFTMLL